MAWHYGTYSCGCEGRVQIYGPHKSREWIAERQFEELCPDCFKKDVEKKNKEAAEEAKEMELPELKGSEKQIAWANSIRVEAINKINDLLEQAPKKDFIIDTLNYIMTKTNARYFIDNREVFLYNNAIKILRKIKPKVEEYQKKQPDIRESNEEAEAEATAYPEERETELVTEIKLSTKEDMIYISYPEFNSKLGQIMRNLNTEWDGNIGKWVKYLNSRTGKKEDRMAEIGNKLLAEGFPIRIYDPEIKQKAIDGDYEPECTRWVLRRMGGKYEGWLAISWNKKTENFYNEARRIEGSRWDNPRLLIPPESFEDVLGFAETYGFKISEKAMEEINRAKRLKEQAIVKGVKTPKYEPKKKKQGILKLEPKEEGIDEELRDTD